MTSKQTSITFIVSLLMFCLTGFANATDQSSSDKTHEIWNELLNLYVTDGVVNYSEFKKNEHKLNSYLHFLNNTNPEQLSADEHLALYINGYNAYTVKLILSNFKQDNPVDSIKDIGSIFRSVWSIKFCQIGGKTYSFDEIEHDKIRKQFEDPRIHFAVNCASKSCPPLQNFAYLPSQINKQLTIVTEEFINSDKYTRFVNENLYVSKIFDWYEDDFQNGTLEFILQYSKGQLQKDLKDNSGNTNILFLKYDWSLNGY